MLKTFGLHGVVLDVDSVSEQPFIYTETFMPRPPSTLKSDYTDRLLFRVRIKKPDWVLSCQMTYLRFSQGPRSELMLECKLLPFSAVRNFRPHCYCGVLGDFFHQPCSICPCLISTKFQGRTLLLALLNGWSVIVTIVIQIQRNSFVDHIMLLVLTSLDFPIYKMCVLN